MKPTTVVYEGFAQPKPEYGGERGHGVTVLWEEAYPEKQTPLIRVRPSPTVDSSALSDHGSSQRDQKA